MKKPLLFLCLTLALITAGCTGTVRPKIVTDTTASWDGNQQNSGVILINPDGSALITSHARDRYNGLIATYGAKFSPPLKSDAGVKMIDGFEFNGAPAFNMDQEHLVKFATMNRWKQSGL